MGTGAIPEKSYALEVNDCNLSFRSNLAVRSLPDANVTGFSDRLLKALERFNLKPEHFSLEENDGLFGYVLKVGLFNGLASIELTPSALEVSFKRLTSTFDFGIGTEIFGRAAELLSDRSDGKCQVAWMGHATFLEPDIADSFFAALAPKSWSFGGRSAILVMNEGLEFAFDFAKLSIEKSYSYNNAGFLTLEVNGIAAKETGGGEFLWAKISDLFSEFGLLPSLRKSE